MTHGRFTSSDNRVTQKSLPNSVDASHMDDAELFCAVFEREKKSGDDRRRSYRHPLGAAGVLMRENDSEPGADSVHVLVFNVSIHGVGFRSTVPMKIDARRRLRIGSGPLFLAARLKVVSSRVRADGTYDIGAEFF
jgi:hypothetical protein